MPTCLDTRLNKVLRDTWGYTGYITSDTDAVGDAWKEHKYVKTAGEASCLAIKNGGCDMNSGGTYFESLADGVAAGFCNMSDVDTALLHTMRLRFELGLFDPIDDQPYWHMPLSQVGDKKAQADNLFMTKQSLVLLRNPVLTTVTEGELASSVLPFRKGLHVAVLGPHGNATKEMVGNYLGQLCPSSTDVVRTGDVRTNPHGDGGFDCVASPLDAISAANTGGTTSFAQGCAVDGTDDSGFAAAVALAKTADVVVLGLGIAQHIESESHDRTTIDLPAIQHKLAAAIAATGKPTAIFLLHGGMVGLAPEMESNAAILDAGYPGFQGGHALAAAIFGDYNPGGKLPYTLYTHDYIDKISMTNMDFSSPPGRSYRFYTGKPLLKFGFGLSYTTFKLSWAKPVTNVSVAIDEDTWTQQYAATVTNTGNVAGDEVVQAYFTPPAVKTSGGLPLLRQLFGYERVSLAPNESRTVFFNVGMSTLKIASVEGDNVVVPGTHAILFTNGVDQELHATIALSGASAKVIEPFVLRD